MMRPPATAQERAARAGHVRDHHVGRQVHPIGEAQVPLRALIRDIGFGLSDRIGNAVDSGGTALDSGLDSMGPRPPALRRRAADRQRQAVTDQRIAFAEMPQRLATRAADANPVLGCDLEKTDLAGWVRTQLVDQFQAETQACAGHRVCRR